MAQDYLKDQYDIASITRKGQEKRANYVQDAMSLEKQSKPTGKFVKVMADIFLKLEASDGCYR
ncbi:MAG: hypothetical protein MUC35_02920 [Candidatus Margulisbacteria bacterium]|jgi:hypothetical protein|nr:hypothetical protein [Candidatus Margulisiibacteriota bacterium]